ncbi:MAG: hypothetical protein V7647_1121, partial [Acidobacteriota bacterium]
MDWSRQLKKKKKARTTDALIAQSIPYGKRSGAVREAISDRLGSRRTLKERPDERHQNEDQPERHDDR